MSSEYVKITAVNSRMKKRETLLNHLIAIPAIRRISGVFPFALVNGMARRYRSKKLCDMPNSQLQAEHLQNCKLLPDRTALLRVLPTRAIAAEIGVAYGDFTEQIVGLTNPKRLHLIDLWEGKRYGEGLKKVQRQFSGELEAQQLVIDRGFSTQVLSRFEDQYFDWVYIDTDHTYSTTKEELLLCNRKIKPDGLICGHDFSKGNVVHPVAYGVIQACNEFCVELGYEYAYLTLESSGNFSFALRRRDEGAAQVNE